MPETYGDAKVAQTGNKAHGSFAQNNPGDCVGLSTPPNHNWFSVCKL